MVSENQGISSLSSREFNQDTGGAKRAALGGPVYITDRGRPAYVLMTFKEFERLSSDGAGMAEQLSRSPGVGEVEFVAPVSSAASVPAEFD